MRFFLDENFPASARIQLEVQGHEVIRAVNIHPHGTDDSVLFANAQKALAIFLTTDKDFFHTVPFLYPDRTAAVVAITLNQPNRQRIPRRLSALLATSDITSNATAICLVTDTRILRRT